MKKLILSVALASAAAFAVPASYAVAAPTATTAKLGVPSQLVLSNTTRVLNTLEKRRAEFKKSRAALNAFVYSEFNQMFDRDYAGTLVLGINGRGATPADVRAFSDALADSLMQRYGSSLLDFNTRLTPRVKSEIALPQNKGVRVVSELTRSGGDPIPVTYLMRQTGGTWKVFDVMVEGVSFVQTFRNQFDAPLRQKGIKAVTAELRAGTLKARAN